MYIEVADINGFFLKFCLIKHMSSIKSSEMDFQSGFEFIFNPIIPFAHKHTSLKEF